MIAELFTEGVPLFDLSQLLAYRNGQFFPEQVLNKIEDRSIRDLVTMLQLFAIKNLIELCSCALVLCCLEYCKFGTKQ